MSDQEQFEDVLLAVVQPILEAMRVFEYGARNVGPNTLELIVGRLQQTRTRLRSASEGLREALWPVEALPIRESVATAYRHALRSLEALDEIDQIGADMGSLHRVLSTRSPMNEAVYPLAQHFSLIHRFFLDPRKQHLPRVVETQVGGRPSFCGVNQVANGRDERGGFSLYVPETYDSDRQYPTVFALHGGSGHGSTFLWSWLRTARTEELVLVSPTSVGDTWAIMGPDHDLANLRQILHLVKQMVNVDDDRSLLTGMSDGGTYTYVAGCLDDSPFTHLAPCSASFHPTLIEVMSKERLQGLPICITHGALDWLFTVDIAQMAEYLFTAAGANVFYREIADLSHAFPQDANPELVDWFLST